VKIAMLNWGDRVAFGGRSLQVRDISAALEAFGHETLTCDARSVAALRRCLLWRPDLLHAHGGITPALGSLLQAAWRQPGKRPPMICTLHGWHYQRAVDALERTVERLSMHACARITVPNQKMRAALPPRLQGRATVIPNGIPAVHVTRRRADRKHTDVIWLGRVSSAKGIQVALQAFTAASSEEAALRLHVVGAIEEPLLRPALSAAQADSGGRIEYRGALDRPWQCVQPAILLHTPRYDAFPRVILEAMSLGIPVVATAVGGIPEMLEDGISGLLAADGDVGALAAHVTALTADPDLGGRLGRAARERFVAQYRIEVMARRIDAVYQEASRA
jgi:glycosyltransferase involved in cell wall biosynthesis